MLTAIAIGVPWLAAILAAVTRRDSRVIGFAAALVSVAASTLLLRAAPARQSLEVALMVLFSCLTLGATLVIPRRDCTSGTIAGILFILGCCSPPGSCRQFPLPASDGSVPARGVRGWGCCFRAPRWRWASR